VYDEESRKEYYRTLDKHVGKLLIRRVSLARSF